MAAGPEPRPLNDPLSGAESQDLSQIPAVDAEAERQPHPLQNTVMARGQDELLIQRGRQLVQTNQRFLKLYEPFFEVVCEVGPAAAVTLSAIAYMAEVEEGELRCRLSAAKIGELLGIDRTTVHSHTRKLGKDLEPDPYLRYVQVKDGGGRFGSAYWLVLPRAGLDRFNVYLGGSQNPRKSPEMGFPDPVPTVPGQPHLSLAAADGEKSRKSPEMDFPDPVAAALGADRTQDQSEGSDDGNSHQIKAELRRRLGGYGIEAGLADAYLDECGLAAVAQVLAAVEAKIAAGRRGESEPIGKPSGYLRRSLDRLRDEVRREASVAASLISPSLDIPSFDEPLDAATTVAAAEGDRGTETASLAAEYWQSLEEPARQSYRERTRIQLLDNAMMGPQIQAAERTGAELPGFVRICIEQIAQDTAFKERNQQSLF